MSTDAIAHIMSEIFMNIPTEILNAAFTPDSFGNSIDSRIIDTVIRPRVLLDVNLIDGKFKRIPLQEAWKVYLANPTGMYTGLSTDATVYNIPGSAREDRPIVSVERIVFSTLTTAQGVVQPQLNQGWGNTIDNLAATVVSSRTFADVPSMPTPLLLSSNMVRLTPNVWTDNLILECKIAFDERFTNIHHGMIAPLREMSLAAVKMYIYKELIVKIDANEVVSGMALGKIKEIVESYSDQAAVYNEARIRFNGSKMLDPDTAAKMLFYML